MVREYLKLSPGPPSPVPPSELPQQEVRGPAGGGEVGGQCDNPTQQQVLTGGPAGWDPPQFSYSSTDVRERVRPPDQKLSPTTLVTLYNRFCHQKPAGNFCLPKISSSEYCLFCNRGAICLGQFCNGKKTPTEKRAVFTRNKDFLIPGLDRSNTGSSTVLTKTTFSVTKKSKVSALSPYSSIFRPVQQNPTPQQISSSPKMSRSVKHSKPKLLNYNKWYEENKTLQKKLRTILLQASLKSLKTDKKQKTKPENIQSNSYLRKLSISELPCSRKSSSKSFPITSSNPPISSPITASLPVTSPVPSFHASSLSTSSSRLNSTTAKFLTF